jgi:uncharacterized protein
MTIDADGHVIEDLREIHDYLDAPYRDGSALRHGLERGHSYWPELDGFSRPAMANRLDLETDWWTDASLWLQVLDEAELERTVLHPTVALAHGRIRDVDWAVHLARAYNLWIEDRYYRVDDRLGWVALLPLQEPIEAAAELRRSVTEGGARGGVLTPAGLNQALGAAAFYPIYEEAERLNVPLIVHGAPAVVLPDIFDRFSHVHVLAHPILQLMSMTSMFKAGVFDKFTKLRVGFFEAGASWVPFLVNRLDRTTSILGNEPYGVCATEDGPSLPSRVIQEGRVFFSVEGDEPLVGYVLDQFGGQCLCFASDFPHEQGSANSVVKEAIEISERDDLSDEQKRAVLHDNAILLYGAPK